MTPLILIGIVSARLYAKNSKFGWDFVAHIAITKEMIDNGQWFLYTSYHSFLILASKVFSLSLDYWGLTFLIVTSAFVLKLYFSKKLADWILGSRDTLLIVFFATTSTAIINPFDSHDVYLGQVGANVYHNPTTLIAMPFAVLTFYQILRYLKNPELKEAIYLGIGFAMLTSAKPNLSLVLLLVIPVTLIFANLKDGGIKFGKTCLALFVSIIPSLVILAISYMNVSSNVGAGLGFRTVVLPFREWQNFSENIPLSLLLSVIGPLCIAAIQGKEFYKRPENILSWTIYALALFMYAFLGEMRSGEVLAQGNWTWAASLAAYLLFLSSMATLLQLTRGAPDSKSHIASIKIYLAWLLMFLHTASGILYLFDLAFGSPFRKY